MTFIGAIVLMSELPESGLRIFGALASAVVIAAGFALLVWWDDRRPARAAGVVLSALGVIPLLVFVFLDPTSSEEIYLGAALLGIWAVLLLQVGVDDPSGPDQTFDPFAEDFSEDDFSDDFSDGFGDDFSQDDFVPDRSASASHPRWSARR